MNPHPFPCICCENAIKPMNHTKCASVALMLMHRNDGESIFDLTKAKEHCSCFRQDVKLHLSIVNQLREQHIEKSASFELKPLQSKNGLTVQVPKKEFGKPKSILTDFDDVEEDSDEDDSEYEEEELTT